MSLRFEYNVVNIIIIIIGASVISTATESINISQRVADRNCLFEFPIISQTKSPSGLRVCRTTCERSIRLVCTLRFAVTQC